MTDARYARMERIFEEACDLEPEKRARFLDEACAGEPDIRAEVEALLAADAATDRDSVSLEAGEGPHVLAREFAENHIQDPDPERTTSALPQSIGPYRILSVLDRGGMGLVYRAEQSHPRREVALKVLQPGFVRGDMIKRFEREARVLGLLQHPGIASIHDAGTCDLGYGEMPYFAMELVEGTPLTKFATEHDLDTSARLTLLAELCEAVQHAHEHGVIHRDLKPGNILVVDAGTGGQGPRPKILDFGIARTTDADKHVSSVQTRTGELLGTLPYMSPEQVSDGTGIDARSDVYALGVILYELLAGQLPLDLEGRSLTQVARIVRDLEPAPLGRVRREHRGDLETICAKALAKEREMRYGTAAEFGADLRRFMKNEPITARPQTTWYQLKKFVRRNKVLVGGVAATFAALVAGTAVAVWFMLQAQRAEALARENELTAKRDSYVARIAAAQASIGTDPFDALHSLEKAPTELRGWEWHWIRGRADPIEFTFTPPRGRPMDVAFRSDGTLLCLARGGTNSDEVTLYEVEKGGAELARWSLPDRYQDLFLSRDGDRVAAEVFASKGALPSHVRLFDAASGHALADHEGPVSESEFARILDPHGAQFFGRNEKHSFPLWLESPDRRLLLAAEVYDRFAELKDARTREVIRTLEGHQSYPITNAAFTKDAAYVITSCPGDSTMRVWEVATGKLVRTVVIENPRRLAVSPDGTSVAVLSGNDVHVWALKEVSSRVIELQDYAYWLAVDQRRGWVAACTYERWMSLLDAWSGKALGLWRAGADNFAFDGEGHRLWLDRDGRFVDTARLTMERHVGPHVTAPGIRHIKICSSPDGSLVARIESDGIVIEAQGGVEAPHLSAPFQNSKRTPLAISPDNRWLAARSPDGELEVYDLSSGRRVATPSGHTGKVFSAVFLPDGTRLISGGNDQTIRLWDTSTFQQVAVLRGHQSYVHDVDVSRDGSWIVSASGDRTVRIWDRVPARERIREERRAALIWKEARRTVLRWMVELRDPRAVADRIAAEPDFDAEQRTVLAARLSRLIGFQASWTEDVRRRQDAYLALVAAAAGSWRRDPVVAWEYLERTPQEQRGPEWQWLRDIEEPHKVEHHYPLDRARRDGEDVAFRSDGTALYAFHENAKVKIVEVASQETVAVFAYPDGISKPSLSRDGKRLYAWGMSAGIARHLLEWDIEAGVLLSEVRDLAHAGGALVLGPERRVAWNHSGTEAKPVVTSATVYDLERKSAQQLQPRYKGGLPCFAPDGQRFFCGRTEFDLRKGQTVSDGWPPRLVLNADGRLLGHLQDAFSFSLVRPERHLLPAALRLEGNPGNGTPLGFSEDSRWFAATLDPAPRIAIWDVATRKRHMIVAATAIAFDKNGRRALLATKQGAKVILLEGSPRAADTDRFTTLERAIDRRLEELLADLRIGR